MNVFYLDHCPMKAARLMCDVHVIKMATETAQILCTAIWLNGWPAHYKPTHIHHGSVIWAASSKPNWRWLQLHGMALGYEFAHRGFAAPHKAALVTAKLSDAVIPPGRFTEPYQAVGEYALPGDPVTAYRNYYAAEKHFLKGKPSTWTNRPTPDFMLGAITGVAA